MKAIYIRLIIFFLVFVGSSLEVKAQGYMSSPGYSGKHIYLKYFQNRYHDVTEIAPGYTFSGRFTVAWGLGFANYNSGLSGFSFSQRLSGLILKQSRSMPISLGINADVQKSFINSAIEGENFPISHFSLSVHYAYRSIDKIQLLPSAEVGTRQDTKFVEDKYILEGGYFAALSITLGYTYFYVEPKIEWRSEQTFFQLSAGVFIP